ncbi:MAG: aspartate:alanine exchanger family transporter [Capsulimonadales bacterium]|nr:aspartate:alanine exchanger family transporter [Capsulimonadales bacterium]
MPYRNVIDPLLAASPLLALFLVAALGNLFGRLRIAGAGLGIAGVLFAGLLVGGLFPSAALPEIVYQLGLVLFVYTIGLSNGRLFFASFKRGGGRTVALTLGVLGIAGTMVYLTNLLLHLPTTRLIGIFCGSLTNTPALAGVLEILRTDPATANLAPSVVVGYSLCYPMGVAGMILVVLAYQRLRSVRYDLPETAVPSEGAREVPAGQLTSKTIRVDRHDVTDTIQTLREKYGWEVVFCRLKRGDDAIRLMHAEDVPQVGDLVSVIGTADGIEEATVFLGTLAEQSLLETPSPLDYVRVFVSNPNLAGQTLADLHLNDRFGALITRLRRGDVEFVPSGTFRLALGDRVRVVAPRRNADAVVRFFGDSYRHLSEVDILTFGFGIALGLLIGMIALPLPGGGSIKLGLAGGPLIVALILGTVDRTGPFVWSLPYGTNLTLRQIGMVLFLAGVGTRSGQAFAASISDPRSLIVIAIGALITMTAAALFLTVGDRLFRIPMRTLLGMLAGLQTQPALLGFAIEQTKDDTPNAGYAAVYPIATIGKILLAQFLLRLLTPS